MYSEPEIMSWKYRIFQIHIKLYYMQKYINTELHDDNFANYS